MEWSTNLDFKLFFIVEFDVSMPILIYLRKTSLIGQVPLLLGSCSASLLGRSCSGGKGGRPI